MREVDRWAIEGSVGFTFEGSDSFTSRLQTFGYTEQGLGLPSGRYALGASRVLAPHLSGVLEVTRLSGESFERSIAESTDTASLNAYGAAIYLRASTDVLGRWLGIYGQAGGGLSLGFLNYVTQETGVPPSTTTTYASYRLSAAVGFTARIRIVPLTLFLQGGYDRAPAITDLIGDTRDSGGFSAALGLRVRLGEGQ
jgi:hypothetical protein